MLHLFDEDEHQRVLRAVEPNWFGEILVNCRLGLLAVSPKACVGQLGRYRMLNQWVKFCSPTATITRITGSGCSVV